MPRAQAFGESVEFRGPTLASAKFDGGAAALTFDHVGDGLKANGEAPKGFAIAGSDHNVVDAEAEITGANTVVVSSPETKEPVAVRFAWEEFNDADLWSSTDLPAAPFRTDASPDPKTTSR